MAKNPLRDTLLEARDRLAGVRRIIREHGHVSEMSDIDSLVSVASDEAARRIASLGNVRPLDTSSDPDGESDK